MRIPDLEFTEGGGSYAALNEAQRADRSFGVPPGRYAATVTDVAVGRNRKNHAAVLWVAGQLEGTGGTVFAWQALASSGEPLDLTGKQLESLREFAARLGVNGRPSAEQIVALIGGMTGDRVTVRVVRTPYGQHATFVRDEDSGPVTGEVLPVERSARSDSAHVAYRQLVGALEHVNAGIAGVCEACYQLREAEGWVALGYTSLRELCAQPEVTISAGHFYKLAQVWQAYVVDGGLTGDQVAMADVGKLTRPLAKLNAGEVGAEDALNDAIALADQDLREKYTVSRDATAPPARCQIALGAEDAAVLADVLDRAEVLDALRERLLAFCAEHRP